MSIAWAWVVLSWVSAWSTSALDATPLAYRFLCQLEALLIGDGRFVQKLLLRIQRAELKIILRQLGLSEQADGFEVCRARLGACRAGFDETANPAPDV